MFMLLTFRPHREQQWQADVGQQATTPHREQQWQADVGQQATTCGCISVPIYTHPHNQLRRDALGKAGRRAAGEGVTCTLGISPSIPVTAGSSSGRPHVRVQQPLGPAVRVAHLHDLLLLLRPPSPPAHASAAPARGASHRASAPSHAAAAAAAAAAVGASGKGGGGSPVVPFSLGQGYGYGYGQGGYAGGAAGVAGVGGHCLLPLVRFHRAQVVGRSRVDMGPWGFGRGRDRGREWEGESGKGRRLGGRVDGMEVGGGGEEGGVRGRITGSRGSRSSRMAGGTGTVTGGAAGVDCAV
ncbi:unnamed protein product [Closterium sp. Naga37s-1]|nr:unnamed protein product [Closterium sp. Naga37s-1]